MRRELLHDALNLLDDDMIEAVEVLREKKRAGGARKRTGNGTGVKWLKWGTLAACFCVMVAAAALNHERLLPGREGSTEGMKAQESERVAVASSQAAAMPEDVMEGAAEAGQGGVVIPKREVNLNRDDQALMDMLAFFIYQGRSYVECERISDGTKLVGEYLGTATGSIDEWTTKDGYVELAGSISGDFYAVNGYDPTFMLCMKRESDSVHIFINDNDISLQTGEDLFEDRLHLTGNYEAVEYQTRSDWNQSIGEPILLSEEYGEEIAQFVKAVNEAPFILTEDVPLDEGERNIYDREIYHLFFRMKDGMTVHMRLYKGGYVRFQGIKDACVQMESNVFEQMIAILDNAG